MLTPDGTASHTDFKGTINTPEPATMLLLGVGFPVIAMMRKRRKGIE